VNRLIDNILVSVAAIAILLFFKHFIKAEVIVLYSGIMIGVGLFILLFAEKLLDGQPSKIKSFFINTIGILVLIGGINFLMEHFNSTLWWAFGLGGIALYNFHHLISERL
jgi:hypothetical protein